MGNALCQAIKRDHEVLALQLLEEGASTYINHAKMPYYTIYLPDLTLLAMEEGNKKVTQKILSIGSRALNHNPYRWLGCLADLDLMKEYLSCYNCNLRYRILQESDWSPKYNPTKRHNTLKPETHNPLVSALKDKRTYDAILDSKLATAQLLTACLATAVSQNNATLARELINKGANASDEKVLTCATRWGTKDLFQLLLDSMNHPRPVVTKGLRTVVLKGAIEQGPDKYELVRQLIESESVDIFDAGYFDYDLEVMTPLGVTIRSSADGFCQEFSYNVARLLLDHGCDPDSIVLFRGDYTPPTNRTALLEAIEVGNEGLVKLLIEYGANVNLEPRHLVRRTPLQKAAEQGDLEMVRLLLHHGADVNAKPAIAMGGTALQFAAISGNCVVACELLSQGALLYTPPPKIGGRWPIEGAAEHGRIEMIQFLWNAKEGTLFTGFGDNGFREKNFKKAMRLARENHHYVCVELIAQLANLPVTATDVPPVISPMYIDWPPPERPID
ncbi:hypothetical protein CIB48_g9390 [Xylaria polymorpha]|nr:hypothetical protein CIB48_g9390 [Xylaria polymorpha]